MEADRPSRLPPGEAARQLGLTVHRIYDLIDKRELPALKVGRHISLRQADVDAYRRSHPDCS